MLVGCEGKQATSPPQARKDAAVVAADAAPSIDASLDPSQGTGVPAPRQRPPTAAQLREAALPQRTACKETCKAQEASAVANWCWRWAELDGKKSIIAVGSFKQSACVAHTVTIDCCPAVKPTDHKGIAKKL